MSAPRYSACWSTKMSPSSGMSYWFSKDGTSRRGISRVIGSLERRDPAIVGGAHSVLRGHNLAEHVL